MRILLFNIKQQIKKPVKFILRLINLIFYYKIIKLQNELFEKNYKNSKKMIVFLNFADNGFCGGIMTIFYYAKISRQMKNIHGCDVLLANFFNKIGKYYINQPRFRNDETLYRIDLIMEHAKNLDTLILHVPEMLMEDLAKELIPYKKILSEIKNFHINVLNQNVDVFCEPGTWKSLWDITDNITQTTGFDKYTTQAIADYYQLPLYRLIGYNDLHEGYEKTLFEKKENLIVYSVDLHLMKDEILKKLKKELPNYEFKQIRDMTFDEWMGYCQKAKYSLTFGEGFDGYFTTIFFTGGVGFTVYNKTFFPKKSYMNYKTVYASYEDLKEKIVDDIKYLDLHPEEYAEISKKIEALNIETTYNKQLTWDLLEKFYKKEPTFIPRKNAKKTYTFRERVTYSNVSIQKENLQEKEIVQ